VRFPVLALSIADDELMTLRGTHSLVALYENARTEVRRIAPEDLELRRIGHFGPFRGEQETRLWPRMAQWLVGLAPAEAA
jgi:predicted alpha/beta hydrolase